jgi:hypothetical protein
MAGWLATKYGIMQQQADTAAAAQRSLAGLQGAQAQRTIQMTPAEVEEQRARASQLGAQATATPALLELEAERRRIENLNTNSTGYTAARRASDPAPDWMTRGAGGGMLPKIGDPVRLPGLRKGLARVPGKGDGTKDTVPAMLAPGEAVLNKSAAEGMGRGLIAALNKLGAEKMGMV